MKRYLLFLLLIFCQSSIYSQVYNKKIIYQFQVEYTSKEGKQKKQMMYLVCHGKKWKIPPHKQFSIAWADEGRDVFAVNNSTGVIDNAEKIWIHPPRHDIYYVHEFTPFPEVRFPLKAGKQWINNFGYVWSSEELNIPAGVKVKPHYTIESQYEEYSKILRRNITCYKIMATIHNSFITSKWIGVFNEELGFIKMEFQNTDQSITIMTLEDTYNWTQAKERFGLFAL
ncbi:hypothetical protein [Marinifilum caeruleilacunae]|uniref:Uncharacterized protein n=1 Tax=Marinifilum caeruleilacunae TaxID=2499076 RepID=A0ABX1X2J1_9BACT|nr:hypothetical protein [Marinifilum caeruleilacunae]NOU62303.1 hypothetical protein [Marinifilum caeruleilacunae]